MRYFAATIEKEMRKSTKGEWIALVLTAIWAAIIVIMVYRTYNP
jgi:hypothetical protein